MKKKLKNVFVFFRVYVKAQKSLSSDIARGSPKSLNKVAEDIEV